MNFRRFLGWRPRLVKARPKILPTASPANGDMENVEHLYALMPLPSRVGLWRAAWQWFVKIGEVKSSSDLVAFFLKVLPVAITTIALPVFATFLFLFHEAISWLYVEKFSLFLTLSAIVLTCILFLFIWFYLQKRLHNKLIMSDHHNDFIIIQSITSAYISSPRKAVYAFRWVVELRRDNVERFPVLYNWSGEGGVKVVPRNHRYSATAPTKIAGNYSRSDIIFDKPMRVGRQYIIEYSLIMPESLVKASPHLGISIFNQKYPFFNTHLIVAFSDECSPVSICREYYLGGFSQSAIDSRVVSLDCRVHHWPVKPQFNWSYCIAWDFGE